MHRRPSIQQVLAPCPSCKVEGALVELYDTGQQVGAALEARCRMCSYYAELGEEREAGARFESVFEVMAALDRWSEQDGEEDVRTFTAANFQGLAPEQVAERILAGLPVETGFDVIAWFFPNAGAGAVAATAEGTEEAVAARPPRASQQPPLGVSLERKSIAPMNFPIRMTRTADPERSLGPPPADPMADGCALVAVVMADGVVTPAERKLLERLSQELEAPLPPEGSWRVWRPQELGIPRDPPALLKAMRRLAMADGDVDGSEVRVIREYARAWQLPFDERSLPRGGTFSELRRTLATWWE